MGLLGSSVLEALGIKKASVASLLWEVGKALGLFISSAGKVWVS